MTRHKSGKFKARPLVEAAPLFAVAFARPVKSDAVARGNRTRRSMERRASLAMFGVVL